MKTKDKIEIAIRYTAYLVCVLFVVFRIAIPYILREPLYLDQNDGYVIGGCLVLALTMEVFKAYIKKKTK